MNMSKKPYIFFLLIVSLLLLTACSNNNLASPNTDEIQNRSNVNEQNEPQERKAPLEDPTVLVGTRENPLPLNTTILFNGEQTLFDTFQAEITLLDLIRGPEALSLILDANRYNPIPEEGKEYLLAKFRIRALSSKNDAVIDINNTLFDLVSEDGKTYDSKPSISGLTPSLSEMYAGGTLEGYTCFLVDVDDRYPNIVFLERNNGGFWFSTNPNASLASGSTVYVPSETIPKPDATNATIGSRLNPYRVGEKAIFDGMESVFDTFRATLVCEDIIRGDSALDIVANATPYNELPKTGKEYLVARVKITAESSKDNEKIEISNANFTLVSQDGVKYDTLVPISGLEPKLSAMYPGDSQEGYVCFIVDKKDKRPQIVFLERDNNGLWFSTHR